MIELGLDNAAPDVKGALEDQHRRYYEYVGHAMELSCAFAAKMGHDCTPLDVPDVAIHAALRALFLEIDEHSVWINYKADGQPVQQ